MPDAGASRSRLVDVLLAALVVVATALHLYRLPHSLGGADESFFLYQAKRIRDGEVMYRDFFQFAAPGAWYAFALLFRLFGTTIATACLGMAGVHAVTGVALYATCRSLGVRREVALGTPLAYLALCASAWPIASPHWVATAVVALLVLGAVRAAHPLTPRATFGLGALVGLVTLVHQQKGAAMAAGVATLVLADRALSSRYRLTGPSLLRQATALVAGALVVVGPVAAALLAVAGSERLVQALVVYPLHDYRTGVQRVAWASMTPLSRSFAEYTWIAALRWTPIALVPGALRAAVNVVRGVHARATAVLVRLTVLFAFSAASIAYYADFIHVAFIAPIALVALAESVEWALLRVRPARAARAVGVVAAVVAAVFLARRLADTAALRHRQYPLSHETAFGRIDFTAPWEAVITDALRARLDATPSREMFCYPMLAGPYLTAGGRNPTPFEVLATGLSTAQVDEALAIVKARRVPYVVAGLLMARTDPLRALLDADYEPAPELDPAALGAIPGYVVYARKDLVARRDGPAS